MKPGPDSLPVPTMCVRACAFRVMYGLSFFMLYVLILHSSFFII